MKSRCSGLASASALWDTLLVAMSVMLTWLYVQAFGASVRAALIAGTFTWLFFSYCSGS